MTPNLCLQTGNFTVTQSGDQYRNFVIPTGLTQTSFAIAVEVITVNSKPIATINQPAIYSVPQTLVGANCGSCTYQWYLNDNPINATTASSYAATQAGIYYLETYNGCYVISDTVILGGSVPCTITVSAAPSNGGSITGGGTYALGTNATVTAIPNNGYSFVNWTENGTIVGSQNPYSFTVSQNRNLVANFERISGIKEINQLFTIFPSPLEGAFSMSADFHFTYKMLLLGVS